jgi:hypothetical protein
MTEPCEQKPEIAVLKEMAVQNRADHLEFKADLKTLIAWKWQMIGGGITACAILSTLISLLISVIFKH